MIDFFSLLCGFKELRQNTPLPIGDHLCVVCVGGTRPFKNAKEILENIKDMYLTLRRPCKTLENIQKKNLGWHVCRMKLARNIFFEARIFSQKMFQYFPLKMLNLHILWDQKSPANSCQISPRFPSPKSKQITDQLLQERKKLQMTNDIPSKKKHQGNKDIKEEKDRGESRPFPRACGNLPRALRVFPEVPPAHFPGTSLTLNGRKRAFLKRTRAC